MLLFLLWAVFSSIKLPNKGEKQTVLEINTAQAKQKSK